MRGDFCGGGFCVAVTAAPPRGGRRFLEPPSASSSLPPSLPLFSFTAVHWRVFPVTAWPFSASCQMEPFPAGSSDVGSSCFRSWTDPISVLPCPLFGARARCGGSLRGVVNYWSGATRGCVGERCPVVCGPSLGTCGPFRPLAAAHTCVFSEVTK